MSQPARLHNSPSSTNLQQIRQLRLPRILEPIQEEELKEGTMDQLAALELQDHQLREAIYTANQTALSNHPDEIEHETRDSPVLIRTNQVRAPQISARADQEGYSNYFEEEFERRRMPRYGFTPTIFSSRGRENRINLDVQFDPSDFDSDSSFQQLPDIPRRTQSRDQLKSSMTIPNCWSEILEKDNSAVLVQLKDYSPLTLLLASRILNDQKTYERLAELNIGSWEKSPQGGTLVPQREVVVLASILEFAHFNLSLGMRDPEAMKKVKVLLGLMPKIKELSRVFRHYNLGKKVAKQINKIQELLLYKIIFDLYERYFQLMGDTSLRKLRKALIPLALRVFNEIDSEHLEYLNKHLRDLSKSYPSMKPGQSFAEFNIFESRQEYLDYYEKLSMQLENQFAQTTKQYKYHL